MALVHRHYKVVEYSKGDRRYLQLVVQFTDAQGVWRTRAVRSYGQVTPEAVEQAQSDIVELQQYAGNPNAPIPVAPVNEAIWRNYCKVQQAGLPSPLDPGGTLKALSGVVEDIAHVIGWVISDAVGAVATKVNITQPNMSGAQKQQFIQWLASYSPEEQRKILAYQWRYL